MKNVEMTVSDDKKKLTIVIDLTQRGGLTATGKSISVATTSGNQQVEGTNVLIGINAYVKR